MSEVYLRVELTHKNVRDIMIIELTFNTKACLKYFFKEWKSLPAEISHPAKISLPTEILMKIIFICPSSTETWKGKIQLRVEATKKLRLVCKNWYECLHWNVLFSNNFLSLKVFCHHKTPGKPSQRLVSDEINDMQLFYDKSMFLVTMFFTQEKLEKCKIPLSPNSLVIEHGFQLSSLSQFNLQRVCKLVMAKDEASSCQYDIIVGQLMNLLQSIAPESLKILILNRMHITNEMLLFLSSRFSKLEYLALPNCTIDNSNIYWKFSSLKILTLTLQDLFSYGNIVLHYLDNETNRQLKFDDRIFNFM
jgi:hypothetical protein